MSIAKLRTEINRTINRKFFCNERLQSLVWKFFYTPDSNRPSVDISSEGRGWQSQLEENGIVVLEGKFPELADYLEAEYFSRLNGEMPMGGFPHLKPDPVTERTKNMGTRTGRIDFSDRKLDPILFDADLLGIIYNYYRRQPFYRHRPTLAANQATSGDFAKQEIQTKYHIDLFRQVSFMFLCNDVTVDDTHLQYAAGSHTEWRKNWDRFSYTDEDIEKRYRIIDAVGPKGTLIVFDAGSGYHRGLHKPNTVRKILHTNITTGHYLNVEESLPRSDWAALSGKPEYVRRTLETLR